MKITLAEKWFEPKDIIEGLQCVFYRRVLWGLFWFRVRWWMFKYLRWGVKCMVKDKPVQEGEYWTYTLVASDKRYKIK